MFILFFSYSFLPSYLVCFLRLKGKMRIYLECWIMSDRHELKEGLKMEVSDVNDIWM